MAAIMRWLLVVFWVSVIFVLSSIAASHVPFAHYDNFLLRNLARIGEYAVLTALVWWALQKYTSSRGRAWLLAALVAALYGVSDAWLQAWIAGRQGALRDMGFDALGIAASYALAQRRPFTAPGIVEGTTSRWQCPECQGTRVYRSRRRGLLGSFSRLIRLAPFRCDICWHRFWRFTWRGR
jgi:hypothetical protein